MPGAGQIRVLYLAWHLIVVDEVLCGKLSILKRPMTGKITMNRKLSLLVIRASENVMSAPSLHI